MLRSHERARRLRFGRVEWLYLAWLGVGVIVWLGVFDYVNTRGHREYLYRNAELRLGIQPPPGKSADLREVMAIEGRLAKIQATAWAAFIVAAGWSTVALLSNRK